MQSEAARAEQLAVQLAAASAELDQLSSPLDPALPEADRTSVSSSAWSLPREKLDLLLLLRNDGESVTNSQANTFTQFNTNININ